MVGLLGGIALKAGASLLSGALNSERQVTKSKTIVEDKREYDDRQTSTSESSSRIDFEQMRADAVAGGFNPLSAMRYGAMSGYLSTVANTTGHQWGTSKSRNKTKTINKGPKGSMAAAVGDAIVEGVNTYVDYDPLEGERNQLEVDLMHAELGRMQQLAQAAKRPTGPGGRFPAQNTGGSNPLETMGGEFVKFGDSVYLNPKIPDPEMYVTAAGVNAWRKANEWMSRSPSQALAHEKQLWTDYGDLSPDTSLFYSPILSQIGEWGKAVGTAISRRPPPTSYREGSGRQMPQW